MPETIELLDRGEGDVLTLVLRIDTAHPLPLTVGLSFRGPTSTGQATVVDLPPRRLRRTGIVLWRVTVPAFHVPDHAFIPQGPRSSYPASVPVALRLSTWTPGFGTRLADTGWLDELYVPRITPAQHREIVSSTREEDCWEP